MKLSQISPSLLPLLASLSNAQELLPFTVNAVNPAAWFNGQPVNARGGLFWAARSPTTACPLPPVECAPGVITEFIGTGTHLNVQVPSGQQVYVAPNGALAYTFPDTPVPPPGSYPDPFEVVPTPEGIVYRFQGGGFAACPVPEGAQVFAINSPAAIELVPAGPCIPFEAIAMPDQTVRPKAYAYV